VNWNIERAQGADLDLDEVLEVYLSSGLGERRPIADRERFGVMVRNANLIVTCRIDKAMVGIARCVSDFSYVTYLSDIAVGRPHQRSGIGRALIEATRKEAPQAKIYYPHIGFSRHDSAWVLNP
jgi:ribosomal protein S18 acetylase RimI-like enzyme